MDCPRAQEIGLLCRGVRCGEVAVSGGSNVHLYSFKTKSNRSEYVRKSSTPIQLRLVPPRHSFPIPAMSSVQLYFSSSKITRVFQR